MQYHFPFYLWKYRNGYFIYCTKGGGEKDKCSSKRKIYEGTYSSIGILFPFKRKGRMKFTFYDQQANLWDKRIENRVTCRYAYSFGFVWTESDQYKNKVSKLYNILCISFIYSTRMYVWNLSPSERMDRFEKFFFVSSVLVRGRF